MISFRFPLALALAPLALAANAAVAQPAAAQTSELAQVQSHLKAVNSMTADFAQTDRAGKTLTGKLTLKQPGKVRFQYEKGVPILLVADGKSLWFIDYEVKQVERWPIGGSPLGVLIDPSKDLSRIAKVLPSSDERIVLVQARDPKRPEYGTITLAFAKVPEAPAGLRLEGWVALDSQNNRTTVRLDNQRYNVAVADNSFRWNDPRPSRRR